MHRLIIAALLVTGCATSQPEKWELSATGEKLICLHYEQDKCGLALQKCGDERTVDFLCVTEARYLGPGDAFEPEMYEETSKGKSK